MGKRRLNTLKAMRAFLALPVPDPSERGRFLQPVRAKAITFANLLARWCKRYTPGYGAVTPTLMRKWYETMAAELDPSDDVRAIMARLNAHHKDTGNKYYLLNQVG